MIYYDKEVQKAIKKSDIPTKIVKRFHNAFVSLDLTKDLNLFDVKKVKGSFRRNYCRLRKGKFRTMFFIENDDFYIVYIGKREEVYDQWQ
ncbi:MAG TPA: hypothetical protein PLR54_08150 [Spirochaetota bacterium]|nr:hypothetical protein [Spirochaetota bacterium]HOF14373.1 hypothetical protein [Spirochaetota bacterium]HOT20862.1 hypothetical protein [Spirochaetota bacterium]HPD03969.1 hypothetical protein [Spirochaetota bacterium]HPK43830.1 hypothetical protein [Spirochaetota bacterium]